MEGTVSCFTNSKELLEFVQDGRFLKGRLEGLGFKANDPNSGSPVSYKELALLLDLVLPFVFGDHDSSGTWNGADADTAGAWGAGAGVSGAPATPRDARLSERLR